MVKIKQLRQKDLPALREQILQQQDYICPICGKDINDPCVDHSHTKRTKGTGQIRGVVCRACNVLIAKVENNCVRYGVDQNDLPDVLRNMADYLESEHLPILHPSETPKPPILKKSSYNKLKKQYNGRAKFPEYPKSGQLTKELSKLFQRYNIEPEFYKRP